MLDFKLTLRYVKRELLRERGSVSGSFFGISVCNHKIKVQGLKVETCNTTVSMRKATTSRIESYMRHIVYHRVTVMTLHKMSYIVGLLPCIFVVEGRILSHRVF